MGLADTLEPRLRRLVSTCFKKASADDDGAPPKPGIAVIATGKPGPEEDVGYLKSYALLAWLFGAELQNTALFVTDARLMILVGDSETKTLLQKFVPTVAGKMKVDKTKPFQIELVDATETTKIGGIIAGGPFGESFGVEGKPLGMLKEMAKKDLHPGDFFESVSKAIKSRKEADDTKEVDIAPFIAKSMSVKDEAEEETIRRAAIVTSGIFRNFLVPKLETILDTEEKVSHSKLATMTEEAIYDPAKSQIKKVKADRLDSCFFPIIQSGENFDLRPSAASDENNLTAGCVIASLGVRYYTYCSSAARTFLVDATPMQRKNYEALLEAFDKGLEAMKPGAQLKSCYEAVSKALSSHGLKEHMTKSVGFLMGIEYRESLFVLNAKNVQTFKPGMVFSLSVGLQNLTDKDNGKYALMVADTVLIARSEKENPKPDILTHNIRKTYKSISYKVKEDDDEDDEASQLPSTTKTDLPRTRRGGDNNPSVIIDADDGGRTRRNANPNGAVQLSAEELEKRAEHQEALAKKLQEEGLARLRGSSSIKDKEESRAAGLDERIAYKAPQQYPSQIRPRQLFVDMDKEALILPINGMPVPFHIAMVKNVTKSDEGSLTYLRVNFHVPQSIGGTRFGGNKKTDGPVFPNEHAHFVKELSFKSANPSNLNDVLRKTNELKKRFTSRQQAAAEAETLVEQPALVLDRDRVPRLSDVSIRPPIATGKHNTGHIEAHSNGFRYRAARGNHVDVMYSNIKHCFFQEAKGEVIVLIHFHLKNPIVVGKKKTNDVQFFTEVMEAAVKLNETRRRKYDMDELEEEQRERELRNKVNKIFWKFTKDVFDRHGIEFEVPYRQLGFSGAPDNSTVFLIPTVSCIISLVEWPPFVLNLEDVVVCHFERVSFQLKNFDLVFVFKNFDRAPNNKQDKQWLRIGAIPTKDLEGLKKFLNEQELKYYEGAKNLNWQNILATIREDLEGFYEEGAWGFLGGEDNDADGEDESEDEEDAVFEVSDEEMEVEDSDSEESEFDAEEDDDADALDELEGDSAEGEEELSDSGKDWDELEAEAARDDRRRESDDEGKKGRPRGMSSKKKRPRDRR